MKKYLFFIIVPFIIVSCGELNQIRKAANKEVLAYKPNGIEKFTTKNNIIVLDVNVNGTSRPMFFDTRAPTVLFYNSNNQWIDSLPVIGRLGKVKSASKEDVANFITSVQRMESNIFIAENKFTRVIEWPSMCDSMAGIIGSDFFDMEKKILHIDFDENTMSLISEVKMEEGWNEVKSKFSLGKIKILLFINGREVPFGLDTGFSGSLIIQESEKSRNLMKSLAMDQVNYGILYQQASGRQNDTMITKWLDEVNICDGLSLESVRINRSQNIKSSLVGMNFLKHFNIILDYKDKNVYFQVRKTRVIEDFAVQSILGGRFILSGQKLILASLTQGQTLEIAGFKINDEIVEVNGVAIADLPLCDKKHIFKKSLIINQLNTMIVLREGALLKKEFDMHTAN